MKIKDVIIREDQPAPAPVAKTPNLNYKGSAGAQSIAKQNPAIKNVNQIKAGQVIQLPTGPYTVVKGDTLDAIAAGKFKGKPPGGAPAPAANNPPADAPAANNPPADAPAANNPPAANTAADPSIDPYDPSKDPSLAAGNAELAAPAPVASGDTASSQASADLDRLKQLAIGQPTLNQQASQQGAAMAKAAQSNSPQPNVNALGVAQTANVPGLDGGPQSGQAAKPAPGPADAAPAAARGEKTSPEVSPDTGLSTVPGKLKSAGGDTNVNTASQDEYAWRAKNPNWNITGKQYPGAGQWDPQTGRSKKEIEQGKQNAAAIKGFLNKINPFAKKEQPAQQQGQGATPTPAANPQAAPATLGENELTILKKLSGL